MLTLLTGSHSCPDADNRRVAAGSLLFVPADSERKVAKALDTRADAVILDLEDAVSPSAKQIARQLACDVLRAERRRPIAIRVNAADTDWYLHDLAAIGPLLPDIVMLPKCASAADVRRLCDQLSVLEAQTGEPVGPAAILPLVTETAASLGSMDYRGASHRLCGLAFAGEDLAADLGVEARDELGMNPLLAEARRAVAISAAAIGIPAIDTPFPDPRDEAGLAREAAEAARMGFAGKMCIHPDQIATVSNAFTPGEAKLAWAWSVISAFETAPEEGVTLLGGKMIDRAHLRLAQRYLRQARVDGSEQ